MFPMIYKNGDFTVTIHDDGTKVREWSVDNPISLFPESVDLKITDYCDLGCPFCHEKSVTSGKHCNELNIMDLIQGLPPGVELAIGGGNPMAHPLIEYILDMCSRKGLICNMTINERHIDANTLERINSFRLDEILHGLGVSIYNGYSAREILDRNTVIHIVLGVTDPEIIKVLLNSEPFRRPLKILLLGYKRYGRGDLYYSPAVEKNLNHWRFLIGSLISSKNIIVSFDNLALEQLKLKDRIPEVLWNERYMGEDGKHTMYVDAVNMQYAISSICRRIPVKNRTIVELYQSLNGER